LKLIEYYIYKDYSDIVKREGLVITPETFYKVLKNRPDIANLRYEMTTFCNRVVNNRLYFGCTSWAGDFLLVLELTSGTIRSCNYSKIREPNEAKIHNGLWYDEATNSLIFATSTLSTIDKLVKAPGGKIVRYRIDSEEFEILGYNEPGQYTQATVFDASRQLLYLFSFRAQKFGVFDVRTRSIITNVFMDSIPHIGVLDDRGRCWSTYGRSHKWCCYDPDKGDFIFYDTSIDSVEDSSNVMYCGAGPVDCMINGNDGFIYVSSAFGELYRLDPETGATIYLGRPVPQKRLPGLCIGPDGKIYLAGGDRDVTFLASYDRASGAFNFIGNIEAKDGTKCYRPHALVYYDGAFYITETDVPDRSGFIWKIVV